MFVKSILDAKDQKIITVSPNDLLQHVAYLFKHERIGFAVVIDPEFVQVGTISERDIIHVFADEGDLREKCVNDVMTTNIVMCGIDESLETVRQLMTEKRTRHVLVEQSGQNVGVVSIGDLIKHSLDECRVDTNQMSNYISGQGYN